MLIIVYNQTACKEFILPNIYEADYKILIRGRDFSIREDMEISLQQTMGCWKMVSNGRDLIHMDQKSYEEIILKDGMILYIKTSLGEVLYLILAEKYKFLKAMRKLDISKIGRVTIGKNPENSIEYEFRGLVSGEHAILYRAANGWEIVAPGTNGVFVNDIRCENSQRLRSGDRIYIFGLRMILMGTILLVGSSCGDFRVRADVLPELLLPEIQLRKKTDQKVEETYFRRSPRNLPLINSDPIEIEGPPAPKRQKQKPAYLVIGPAFTMAIPMMLGCIMAAVASQMRGGTAGAFMYTGLITAGGAAIVGTLWAVLNLNYSKAEAAADEEQRFNAYSNYLVDITKRIRTQYQQNISAMNQIYPASSEVLRYNRNSSELWNRNTSHKDFLYARVGLGTAPFQVNITIPKEKFSVVNDVLTEKPQDILKEFKQLRQVPVGINVRDFGMVGILGSKNRKNAIEIMHVLVTQIAASHSYTDVKMVFIYDEDNRDEIGLWECMRWLPHVWSEDRSIRYMAANEIEIHDIFFNLTNVIRSRAEKAREEKSKSGAFAVPYYVLFVSNAAVLEGELLAKYVYENSPNYGLTTFFITDTLSDLPNKCEMIIESNGASGAIYNLMDINRENYRTFVPDQVTEDSMIRFGRNLADIRIREMETVSEIPNSITFLEMYRADTLEDLHVTGRWRKNRSYNNMRALIGRKAGDADCYLDIHEKFHGPHGLIAGTTGSGKSETLQTWMLSLAVNFSPEDVSFFIIDYKGGGMANLFNDLPHLAGKISNLSGNQVRRAMISIESENRRRQQIFADHNVNNIFDYTRLYKNHETDIPLPHLLIIIDEFAELKREEPEFMAKLVSVAQVGRSLGVHLILATQRPSGTVDDNIRSNAKFRLCLRVQDRQDSMDMLHKSDAAFITQAGRGYLQVGSDELYELFQSGYSGAPYLPGQSQRNLASMITRTGRTAVYGNRKEEAEDRREAKKKTQLEAVVEHLNQVACNEKCGKSPQLWKPVLKKQIYLDDLIGKKDGYVSGSGWSVSDSQEWQVCATVGMYDDPENQEQEPLVIDLTKEGHLGVLGSVVSGKSTFLQTMVYAMLETYTPAQLQFYLLDYSSHLLTLFADAPHVGGVVTEQQQDRLKKFFYMFNQIMDERRKLLAGRNYSRYVKEHGNGKLPTICVVIDNYALFRERTGNAYEADVMRIARQGIGFGIFLIVASGGIGHSDIPTNLADTLTHLISLEQTDKFKYMDALRKTHITILPEENVKGRGLAPVGDRVLEFQTALAMRADGAAGFSSDIVRICREMRDTWTGELPGRIPEIPENSTMTGLMKNQNYLRLLSETDILPYAYNMKDASVFGLHLSANYIYLISGRSRTGKTNAFKVLVNSAAQKKGRIIIYEKAHAGRTEMARTAASCGATLIQSDQEVFSFMKEFQPEFIRRNRIKSALLEQDLEDDEIFADMTKEQPIFLFISDLKDFLNVIYRPQGNIMPMNAFFENITEKGSLHNIYIIACVKTEDGIELSGNKSYQNMASYKKGVHLGGTLHQQKIFNFSNISAIVQQRPQKKGFAYASDDMEDGVGIEIVIPLAK